MNIQKNISIKPYNTFGIDAKAKELVEIFSVQELKDTLTRYSEVFPIGGGSNLLITKDIDIPVLKISIKGIEIIRQDEDFVWIEVGAGEVWHEFVQFCIENNYGGVENLSLIPGSVGASPIQNIGAYGVEIKDVMQSCKALHVSSLQWHTFTVTQCRFGYRDSIFKTTHKGQYIITSVTFKLTRKKHQLHIDYGAIKQYLSDNKKDNPTLQDVSQAVIAIRKSKLPDPKELGNSGSFFKNPVISVVVFEALQRNYPNIPFYIVSEDEVKIPAGWLIESLGLKGYRKGNVGVHQQQSLVLVNYGGALGKEVFDLARYIQKMVKDTYGIDLEMEVNVV